MLERCCDVSFRRPATRKIQHDSHRSTVNNHYTRGVREAMMELILGRSDDIVKVVDLPSRTLCSTGSGFIDPKAWPPLAVGLGNA